MYKFFFPLILFSASLLSQSDQVIIDKIVINGNEKTKDNIVLREIEFNQGDTIQLSELNRRIKLSEENLFRTKLFFESSLNWKVETKDGKECNTIYVEVREAWYIYPVVIFELADRNFNVWWNEMGASISRLNIGLRLDHLNTTGRRDKLKIKAQAGYEQKYELEYERPILNEAKTIGASFNVLYSRRDELGYIGVDNILQFAKADEPVYTRFRLGTTWTYRPHYQQKHRVKLTYRNHEIDEDFVNEWNPKYLRNNRSSLRWAILAYEWTMDNTNHFNYPTDGWLADLEVTKEGLGIFKEVDLLEMSLSFSKFLSFGNMSRWSLGISSKFRKVFTSGNPGYYHYRGLGYSSDQLRGYELYIIDGLDFGYTKSHLNFLLFDVNRNLGKWVFIQQFRKFHAKAYLSAALDLGYVDSEYFNENNPLNNTLLIGGGPAVHVLFYNYFLLRMEYSFNREGESGLFLHFKASF